MFNELSLHEWVIFVCGGGITFFLIWLLSRKVAEVGKDTYEEKHYYRQQDFIAAFHELKNYIDHIDVPIFMVCYQHVGMSLTLRNQIKKTFPFFANTIAYDANQYVHQYYQEILLDILRHPAFCQAIEAQPLKEINEIEIIFELPKAYHFKLSLNSFDEHHVLSNVVLVTLIDQSQLVSLNKMRSDFVAHASHELRTPLTSLDGFIQTLLGVGVEDPQLQKKFLEIMQLQVARMIRLTNGLLTLSRVERDEYQLITQKTNLRTVLGQALEEMSIKMDLANITFEYNDITEHQDAFIYADPDQLFQIFHNLLENAMRYAPLGKGKVGKVICDFYFSDNDVKWPGAGWVVAISDNGPGIDKQHIPRLTERFYRADDKNGGTGLGLSIVKHLITRHRGSLAIESTKGQGSSFLVWFPTIDTSLSEVSL
ncbi:sensor histidine kinase [Commensalibacter oyaizuii]|uniref:histidine kinase n=1 Tax=Commensalibacter oyaizuii TaxID=3043873 RepID=A0ABT6Q108_9PROT|nr:ATP-binding protein [Commensalibacter sp. TBRC 16381]MDI2090792.1 ATP-binding protein [Commensalibacter sp. TBRC 16381]